MSSEIQQGYLHRWWWAEMQQIYRSVVQIRWHHQLSLRHYMILRIGLPLFLVMRKWQTIQERSLHNQISIESHRQLMSAHIQTSAYILPINKIWIHDTKGTHQVEKQIMGSLRRMSCHLIPEVWGQAWQDSMWVETHLFCKANSRSNLHLITKEEI